MNIYIEKLNSKSLILLQELYNQFNIAECIYIDADEGALAKQVKLKKKITKLEFTLEDIQD